MATIKQAVAAAPRSIEWTGRGIRVLKDLPGGRAVNELASHDDVADAIRSAWLVGRQVPVAGAYACVLAARSTLDGDSHDCYTRLLYAARTIRDTAPDDHELAEAVKRMLAAGDRANGPVNGTDRVMEEMEAEAASFHVELRSR
jgi:methylthioribose-1-phosphate isomerase